MSTPFQFFGYRNQVLYAENVPLAQIAKEFGTPAYVYSSQAFLEPLRRLQKGLERLDFLICFAVKSNSNIAILDLLSRAGAGMDLVSGGELYRAQAAKVPSNRIVFSGVGKTKDEMIAALHYCDEGIFSFNIESQAELQMLNQVAIEQRRQAPVALRFNPDVDPKTHPYISTGLNKNKFGLQRSEIWDIVGRLPSLQGIELKGISIHIGSQLLSLSPLNDAFSKVRCLIDELNSTLTQPIQFVDLGGGIGISYKDEEAPRLEDYCALIHHHFGRESQLRHPLKIIIEPGRTLSGNSGILLTQILYKKSRETKDFLIVDAAMNDLIRPSLYGSYHEIIPLQEAQSHSDLQKVDVVGPVCESSDCFAPNRDLPTQLQEGDLMAILSAGAYGFSMASNYNSRPRPPEILVRGDQFWMIRQRETPQDLIRGESLVQTPEK